MNLISRGESQLLESGSLGLGQLHIGASDTICRYFLLPYLQKFHRKFPDVPIKITNASSMGCVDLLEQRRVDLIITNFPNPHLNPSYIQKRLALSRMCSSPIRHILIWRTASFLSRNLAPIRS